MTRTERQELAIQRWKEAGAKGTFNFCTGFGKTNTALMIVQKTLAKNHKTVVKIIVPTKVLKDQWEENIEKRKIVGNIEVLIINTAIKAQRVCDLLILDESHKMNSATFQEIFNVCSYKWVLGLTATYERLDGLEKEVMDNYCPICDMVTVEEALENGWLAPYKEYKVLLDVDLTAYKKANTEFMQHFAFFGFDFNLAMSVATNLFAQQKMAKAMNCPLKEVKAHAYSWMRALQFRKKFVADHPKKIEIAKKIIEARKDKKIITFNTSIAQCKKYGMGVIVNSDNTKKTNQKILEAFAKETTGVVHSSKMLIEGLDCPGLSVAIVVGFNSSKCAHQQSCGRVLRAEPGKQAEIFSLVIRGTVEENWYKKATEDRSVIEIDEEELDKILKNETVDKKAKKQEKFNRDLLRF